MGQEALNQVLGLRKARRDLLLAVRSAALQHVEGQDGSSGNKLADEDAKMLRSPTVFFIAEFLFVLKELDLRSNATALEAYLHSHNEGLRQKIAMLRENRTPATPSGLTVTRLEEGILEEAKINEIVSDSRDGFFRFDQSTLGALLIELMVKQSTNVHLSLLGRTGFLTINGRKPKYISSRGKLEELYGKYLNQVNTVFQG